VVALVLVAVLVTVTLAGVTVGALLVGQRRAAAAADLAALAAAQAVRPWPGQAGGDPCGVAGALARANGARLTGCRVRGTEVGVEVAVTVAGPFGRSWTAPGRARAGPSEPSGPSP
jgi:secretion/DNA translocation related TadE-like protein